jgi:hypothetical protein
MGGGGLRAVSPRPKAPEKIYAQHYVMATFESHVKKGAVS